MGRRGPKLAPTRGRALEEGRSTYWSSTSRKCLRGHVSERYTSNKRRVECERESNPLERRARPIAQGPHPARLPETGRFRVPVTSPWTKQDFCVSSERPVFLRV
jgi:hypothetical protein